MTTKDLGMEKLLALPREERLAFCHRVLGSLSDLVEGEAPEELCREVDEILSECQPYHAYRNTLEATLRLLAEHAASPSAGADIDEQRYRDCVEEVRRRLEAK
ncbi:MAG: hypothetical protein KDD47_12995 [Acidobacteria bacterium]|nr:hypothetical protein [Acidobacteriota bacterium]